MERDGKAGAMTEAGEGVEGNDEGIFQCLEILICKLEEIEQKVEYLHDRVENQLFGGINELYQHNVRKKGIDGVRERYAPDFSPFEDGLKQFAPDEDWAEAIYDAIERMREGDGFNDEGVAGMIEGTKSALQKKLAELGVAGKPAGAVSVEIETGPADETATGKFLKRIDAHKKAGSASKEF
jgi:hypothetical protein